MSSWQSLLEIDRGSKILPLLMLCIACFQYGGLTAQSSSLPQEYYSVDDGLSDRNVLDIVQTRDGIIWLATTNGLNRFDGYETLVFNHFPNSQYKIADSQLRKLFLDSSGNIVIVYASTYALFEILNPNTFETETINLLPQYGIKGIPRMIKVNAAGEILILTLTNSHTNIYKYLGDNQFQLQVSVRDKRKRQIASIDFIQLHNNHFLITDTEQGLRFVTPDSRILHHFSSLDLGLSNGEAYPDISTILHQDKKGRIWYALQAQRGIYSFHVDETAATAVQHSQKENYCIGLWEDDAGNILLSWSGDPSQQYPLKSLLCIATDNEIHNFDYILSSASRFIVTAFSKNFFGTIFLGIDTGLKIIQNRRLSIGSILAEDVDSETRGAVMRGITSHDNKMYFAREFNNCYVLDLDDMLFDTLQMIDSKTGEELYIACGRSIHFDQKGFLWGISCNSSRSNGILYRYDLNTCMADPFIFDHPISAMTVDNEGVVWICAEPPANKGMLAYFDPNTDSFIEFKDREGINPLRDASPRCIVETSNGMLWVGTQDGLYKIDREKRQSTVYQATGGLESLASNVVYALHEDDQQRLWIGTTNGFNIFDPEENEFVNYSQQNGLASNIVCGFVPDTNGNYWITTFNGLSYFDQSNNTFRNFYSKDGLTHDEFNRFSYHKGPDGRIYLGGVNGVNIFNSSDLLVQATSATPIISKITRYNAKKDSTIATYQGLSDLSELVIESNDNYFSIHLTMPNFSSPRRNQFKAWLEGYDHSWILQSRNPILRYNKLSPGHYTLHIKGSNAYGTWSQQELLLPIFVEPAFYETTWFYVSCILLFIGILYSIFQYRLEQRLKMERIRTRLSSDLHDEVSGLLSGIAMQTDVLQMTVSNEKNKERLQNIGDVSRTAMSKMSDVIWSIDSRKDRVNELIKRMQEHANEILSPIDISYELKVDRLDLQQKLPVTLRQNLYFIYKEAINNVAKHSGASKVTTILKNDGNQFVMSIQDNGNGIRNGISSNSLKKTGQGLSNLKMRAYRIDAILEIKEREPGVEILLKRKKFA